MARRRSNKVPVSVRDRVRIHRERKKIKERNSAIVNLRIQDINNDFNPIDLANREPPPLKNGIQKWANQYRISKRAVDNLLHVLNSNGSNLPKNHRTLQSTPINVSLTEVAGGKMWFNGLEKCLRKIFSQLDRNLTIKLNFNIDGLPLYNSSKISFLPILASIHGMFMLYEHIQNHSIQFKFVIKSFQIFQQLDR